MDYCDAKTWNSPHARLTNLGDLAGKTIAEADDPDGDDLLIRFTDGTWFYAAALAAGCCGDEEASLDHRHEKFTASSAIRVGLIDQAEYDRVAAQEQAAKEAKERAEYERLKARFEAGTAQAPPGA